MSIEDAREFFARNEYMEFYGKVVNSGYHDAAEKQAEIMDAYAKSQNAQLIENQNDFIQSAVQSREALLLAEARTNELEERVRELEESKSRIHRRAQQAESALTAIRREVADVRAGMRKDDPAPAVIDNSFFVIDEIAREILEEK